MIPVSGVKIVETLFKEQIHHPAYLLIVDLIIFHRQSHHAESKMLFYFFECSVIHFPFPPVPDIWDHLRFLSGVLRQTVHVCLSKYAEAFCMGAEAAQSEAR